MEHRFDAFVIFAEMRTGSNFLEENLNDYAALSCLGELFNPHFIGHDGVKSAHGVSLAQREGDPLALLRIVKSGAPRLCGFRFFHDHDPRVLKAILPDPGIAKIILTRNPLDAFVSRQIARETGQWRLGDGSRAKTATVALNTAEFLTHLDQITAFQRQLLHALQTSGQTAYYIHYDDLNDVDVLNGLTRFLGVDEPKKNVSRKTKVQNPRPLQEKIANFSEVEAALADRDWLALSRTPNFEPRRGRAVPSFVAGAAAPLIFQPVPSGPNHRVEAWMAALDGVEEDALRRGFFQKSLRQWKRRHTHHRSFTMLPHPVERLHRVFARHILPADGPNVFKKIRAVLHRHYDVSLPNEGQHDAHDPDAQRSRLLAFAKFVKKNLSGQTSIRVDEAWASQGEVLRGMAEMQLPDMILREHDAQRGLAYLAEEIGRSAPPINPGVDNAPVPLLDYYDERVEAAVRDAYQRDYMMFGFARWQ
ncbi:MAG: nodulation protein NodH [Pseudomonadota bacterium]